MKGKLMIALVVLALVFGMVLAACDNGERPTIKQGEHETILDIALLGSVNADGKLIPLMDTTGASLDSEDD